MIKLGPIQLEHPFILAPMAGITNSPFRRLMRKLGSSLVVSELVSANALEYSGKKNLELLKFHEEERPIGIQVFGERVDLLCKACQKVEQLGADFVDLNVGCPVPKIVKKGAGAALCKNAETFEKILREIVKSVNIPVSIKMRTGWDEQNRNALDCIKAAAEAGVQWVAIHGRTKAQGYSGLADWDFIGEIKAKSPLPIIGNGDLVTAEIALKKYNSYGVDAVMIGRGALRNPFIFKQAYELWKNKVFFAPTVQDYVSLMQNLRILLSENCSAFMAVIYARKFLAWFSSGFRGCHEFRKKVFTIKEPETLWNEAFLYFENNIHSRNLDYISQPFLMGGHG
ncbi:MAG: tRNA dihydrouridine synthase DusB [Bdellovibrio sp.]|nr:tRNA dihydrouridine synthase DusB [Bdellovibrio sp.]